MAIETMLADALEDLTLEPLDDYDETLEGSLTAGYAMPETGASPCSSSICCCSLGSSP